MTNSNEPDAPSTAHNMRRVTKAEFYAYIGHMNVHPKPEGRYDSVTGYTTEWRLVDNRNLIGVSDSGTALLGSRFWMGA